MYTLQSKSAVKFYDEHPWLDFESMNLLFIDVLTPIIENTGKAADNARNTQILGDIASKIEQLGSAQHGHQSTQSLLIRELETAVGSLSDRFTGFAKSMDDNLQATISKQKDSLLHLMEQILKAESSDSEKELITQIDKNHAALCNKITAVLGDIPKDIKHSQADLQTYFCNAMQGLTASVAESTGLLSKSLEGKVNESGDLLTNVTKSIERSYTQFTQAVHEKMEGVLSTTATTTAASYSSFSSKLNQVEEVLGFLKGQTKSSVKGNQGEAKFETILSEVFTDANIRNTAGQKGCGDFIMERTNRNSILIDTKDYNTTVPSKEVEKIIRDVENNSCHGILFSQNSGIALKENYQIDIHNHNIIVFVHNTSYDPAKILMAVQVIDHLSPIIANVGDSEETISSDMLYSINQEYQQLICQKSVLVDSVKKYQKDIISQISQFDLPKLTKLLRSKFANTEHMNYECEICRVFTGKNAKALSAHMRGCKKKVAQEQKEEST